MSKIELKSSSEVAPTPLMSVQIGRFYHEWDSLENEAMIIFDGVILKTRFVVGTSTE